MPTIPEGCTSALNTALVSSLCSMLLHTAYATTPPLDACSLFTASQVSAVLGVSVSEGQHPIASLLLCGWAPAGAPRVDGKKLSVNLMTERAFEVGKTPMQGIAKTPVSGVADDAYYVTASGLGTGLSIKKGNIYVQIRVGGFPTEKEKELEKALALQMQTKL
jgi:hypothetical protein